MKLIPIQSANIKMELFSDQVKTVNKEIKQLRRVAMDNGAVISLYRTNGARNDLPEAIFVKAKLVNDTRNFLRKLFRPSVKTGVFYDHYAEDMQNYPGQHILSDLIDAKIQKYLK
jgi:hypothetical protein